ncbi:DNA polymerase III subunit delta [Corynebacterium sp. 153RC1]|uniref:DNA polymerase III subunit delta n=1 Tax=unclassified Corynebacterium TaxID=2624378 RepID=UPI00211C513D|nr:DNA polymerase III subunit delta [Corynebacterium sp. 209RC1]MCQ9355376.1 DNA polymerase III subunit delta [Corynebacterium sp. 1222RC1]MCQ9357108.1 DNA polymerase III subunit delta [Corynebacterium sp. 122RC1]MCQ9358917.1 DNA polymerase III subunit delta [Corynebacterium sp. 142RC1]MCQ9360451.1 DNA polymerase III subunit delta [Corynebacterium sp. 153RC1]MCQ9362687.1 DNA polymerase III subunit delta [Corynebacterium sp. 732RC1]MCQ9366120.1 DNA polymerase III subunit delta [Corynebacterium
MCVQVHLIVGENEFLAERAREAVVAQVRAEQSPDVVVSTLRAGDVTEHELIDLFSPSLFGEDRLVVLTNTEDAGKEPAALILDAAMNPAPGITLIISHSGGGRQKQLATKLRKIATVHEVANLKPSERPRWVTDEFRRHGVRVTPDVVQAVLEGVGSDLRELASAISQLVADNAGNVTEAAVREYYVGVAEVSGFDIADLACSGQTQRAVASTRRALQLGTSPVALAAALSMKVSAIARLYSTMRVDAHALAGQLGMAPFVVEKTAKIARRWSSSAVSEAVIVMADLDATVKGQGGDPEYAIEQAVARISQLAG